MKKTEVELYVEYKAKVVEQVLIWLVRDIAVFRYHNSTNYLTKLKQIKDHATLKGVKLGNYALKELSTTFHFDDWFIELVCGGRPYVDGKKKRLVDQILTEVEANSNVLCYIGKKDVTCKSGKKFSHLGWWMLDTRVADKVFADSTYASKMSKRYCEEARYVISKIAFRYSKLRQERTNLIFKKMQQIEKDTTMTKADKEKLREECERGLHGLPYDYLVKSIQREEKSKLRTLQTRIRKMTQKAMVGLTHENEMLKAENEALKAKVKHLEELKDTNSDIPEDDDGVVSGAEAPHKLSFEEFVAEYPDGIDPDTFDFDTLSDECKAKLQAEYDEEQTKIDNTDAIYDFKKLGEAFAVAHAEMHAKPTNVFVAPPELAEKKVVETPVDDIPTPTSKEVTKLERQINRLQEFVNKLYISVNEARQIASFFGRSLDLKEARGGWCIEDAYKHKGQRNTIFGYFKHELDNHQLVTDDAAKFFKGRT